MSHSVGIDRLGFRRERANLSVVDSFLVNIGKFSVRCVEYWPPISGQFGKSEARSLSVVFSPGWAEDHRVARDLCENVSQAGFGVTTFSYPNGRSASISDVQGQRQEIYSAIAKEARNRTTNPLLSLGHSEGGLAVASVAANGSVEGVVLVASAGLTASVDIRQQIRRAHGEAMQDIRQAIADPMTSRRSISQMLDGVKVVVGGPLVALAEARTLSTAYIGDDLLSAVGKDVRVSVLACQKDRLFPLSDMETTVGRLNARLGHEAIRFGVIPTTHARIMSDQLAQKHIIDEIDHIERSL